MDSPAQAETKTGLVARSWLTEHGLPQNTVNALAQTRDGFLWAGTNGGIARFDGVRFRNFGLLDGLGSVRVSALAEDTAGNLWVGTTGGGVSRWENGRFTTFRAGEAFPSVGDILAMTADAEGGVWIGTTDGLILWRAGTFRLIGEPEGLPKRQILALTTDSAGAIWVAVLGEGVWKWNGSRFSKPGGDPQPKDAYSLAAGRDGSIWAGYGNGEVWHWAEGAWKLMGPDSGLPKHSVTALTVDRDGTLWVGTEGQGPYRLDGGEFVPAHKQGESMGRNIRALLVDRQGSIWAGSAAAGLIRISGRLTQFLEVQAPLGVGGVSSIAADGLGRIWVVTMSKGLYVLRENALEPVESPAIPARFRAYSAIGSGDGSVWVAGEQRLVQFRPDESGQEYLDPPIRGEALRTLCVDGESLWIGTYYSTLLRRTGDRIEVVAPANSFGGSITSMAVESPGVLWIGSFGGLYRWEAGKTQSWGEGDGLLTKSIFAMHRDPDGTLWLGTQGGGLVRMKGGRFAHITTRQGLADDVVSQIIADDFGALWLGSNRGIMRLERSELDAVADGSASEVYPVIIDRNEGLLSEQCSNGRSPLCFKGEDGRLYFATARGVAIVQPRDFVSRATATSAQACIEEFRVDGNLISPAAESVLAPGVHRIEISYTAPVLRGGEWVRFRHRLDGIDRGWVKTNGQRRASYDALPPGRYTFTVSATDQSNGWGGTSTSLVFIVQPHWWQTLWFRAGVAAVLAGAAALGSWASLRQKHRRQIAAFERERAQQAELAHAGRVALLGELSASIAHELKQPLTAILTNAQAGLRFIKNDEMGEVHGILTDIAAADRRASEIIGRMRELVKKGEARLEARDLNADLHQALILLRSDLAARKVSVSTTLDPELPLISGDHIQLQQVLLNLIINGCDAMQGLPVEERCLMIETAPEGARFARVSVIDRGPGIAPDLIRRIFEPFYTTKSQGLGMGLSISQAIIKAHGGKLWVENNPGGGAAFHFTLKIGEEG